MLDDITHRTIAYLALFGAAIGIGQVLASEDRITWRIAVGRSIISGGLGVAAGTILLVFPDAPLPALVGLASVMVSLGTSGIERMFQFVLRKR